MWEGGGGKLINFGRMSDLAVSSPLHHTQGITVTSDVASIPVGGTEYDLTSGVYSIFIVSKLKTSQSYWAGIISKGGSTYNDWAVQRNSNTDTIRLYHANESVDFDGVFNQIASGKTSSLFVTTDRSVARLYLDGVQVRAVSSPSKKPEHDNTKALRVGSSRDPIPTQGDYHLAALFQNFVVTQQQIAQLHETPYALLMPVARPFIFDMAGGGGLAAPTLTSPAQFSTQSQPVTLQWSAVAGATKYQVQVAQDSLFTTPSVDQIVTGGTTLGVDGLADNTEHFWRVRAGDDN
jgi:hypothetical protein